MFTINDICNIAMQIECNGEKTYKRASKETSEPQFASLFELMAEEERLHAKWFENIKSTQPVLPEQRELENMGRQLLQDMVKDQTFSLDLKQLARAEDSDDILEQFITFEQDTILFYDFLKGIVEDTATKKQLDTIIQEEYCHIEHIKEMVAAMKERKEHI